MERPRPGEATKRDYGRIAANARELGDRALRNVDAALAEQERVWEDLLRWTGSDGISRDEALAILWNQRAGLPEPIIGPTIT